MSLSLSLPLSHSLTHTQDNLKKEESMKRELQMRLAVAGFMQETLAEMASKKKKAGGKAKEGEQEDAAGAKEVSVRERGRMWLRDCGFEFEFEG